MACIYSCSKNDESRQFIARFFWRRSIDSTCMKRVRFPRIDVFFFFFERFTFPDVFDETTFREIFLTLDYYKIIDLDANARDLYTFHRRYHRTWIIKRVDALFLTERIRALHALHACTVSSRELDSVSWTNSNTRLSLSLSLFFQ